MFTKPYSKEDVIGLDIEIDKDEVMHIHIDLKKDQGLSGSKKNLLVASTRGNKFIPDPPKGKEDYIIGINLFHPVKNKKSTKKTKK